MQLTDLQLDRYLYKAPLDGTTYDANQLAGNIDANPTDAVASGNTVTDVNTNAEQLDGNVIAPGTIPTTTLDIAVWGWTQTCAFTVSGTDTVTWGSGTFTSANGISYSISSGTTGSMAAKTYVYLDINISETVYQTTTSVTAPVGVGKVLIAVCQNESPLATYNLVQATQVVADNIFVNSLSAISANMGSITAGTITVVSGGNTVAITPASTNAIISGPTSAPNFTLTQSGGVVAKSIQILNLYTAGENVTAGRLLCFKNTFAAWGDDLAANRNTTALLSKMTYVDGQNAATNFGSASLCFQGQTATNQSLETYLQLDFSSNPPGLPVWNEVDTVYLRLYIVFSNIVSFGSFSLSRITSAWSEGTVTYNTRPTDDGVNWGTGTVVVESFNSENNALNADGTATGYIDFDITEIYRLWSQGTYTNNGFKINGNNGGNGSIRFGGRTRTGGGTFNQAPFLVSYITKNNPGTGNTIVANDGKVYLASNANYQRVKQLAGICASTVSSGTSVGVYSLADGLLVPSSVISVTNNQDYYLNDSSGTIGVLTNNILESNKWDLLIGTGTPNGLVINKDKRPLFIRSTILATFLPAPSCSMIKFQFSNINGSGVVVSGQIEVSKGFITSATAGSGYVPGGPVVNYSGSISWNSGTAGLITTSGGTSYLYK